MSILKIARTTCVVLAACVLATAHAQSPPLPESTSIEQVRATVVSLIRALVDQGVLGAGKAQEMLRQAGLDPAVLNAPEVTPAVPMVSEAPKPVVRVPYVPQTVKDEMRDEIRQEVLAQARQERWGDPGALPEWMSRFSFFGDMRIRYQREEFAGANSSPQLVDSWYQLPSATATTQGTTKDTLTSREQEGVRARLGANIQMGENFRAQMRVVAVTGDTNTASPVSYNVDQATYGRPLSAGVDLANIQWQPYAFAKATLGRMERPYLGSDLIFANDLSFDGIVAHAEPALTNHWNVLFTAGMHPLTSNWVGPYNSASNQWLYAAQAGARWKAADESKIEAAGGYYDYVALEGQLNPASPALNTLNTLSAPPFRILGNTMFNLNWYSNPNGTPAFAYAAKFRLANATARFDLASFDPIHLTLTADWVRNTGFNVNEIRSRIQGAVQGLPQDSKGLTGVDRPRVTGYGAGFVLGASKPSRLGDWQVFGGYRYLQRDAVPDAFTSTEYRLGGTDQRSTIAGVTAGLSSKINMRLFVTSAKSIDSPIRYDIDTWFVDLYGSF
jgi:hypothetical protein